MINVNFPPAIIRTSFALNIDPANPLGNIISLSGTDYIVNYFNPTTRKNKGSNILLKLYLAQNWNDEEGYPALPDLVLKLCKTAKFQYEESRSVRFQKEIQALEECNVLDPINTINVFHHGIARIDYSGSHPRRYRFYTMEFAEQDLPSFLQQQNPSLLDRVSLFLEICDSLKLIWKANYYHRDIKPDNILFSGGKWKLADLGLVDHRQNNFGLDEIGEWIGPRGWQSPESLNKFVVEGRPWQNKFDMKINHQSDLYQLGKLLWYIIQGNCPEGCVSRDDFQLRDDRLYQTVKTLLNNKKSKRINDIDLLISQIKPVYEIYYKTNPSFKLY